MALNLTTSNFFTFTAILLCIAYTLKKQPPPIPQTTLTFYLHDVHAGPAATGVTVAGKDGAASNILQFGSIAAVDDCITEGPSIESREIGRAQGVFVNSQLNGEALHLAFSVIFTEGEYKGSTLEIQGADLFMFEEREFGVVSGTGRFRFVKGFAVMKTVSMDLDLANLRAVVKVTVTLKHY